MNTRWGEQTRINAAKELLAKSVEDLRGVENLEIGLRVYGHQSPITATYQDCNDTKLEVPFGENNHDRIKGKIRAIQAKGTTPIARSLEAAAGDFPNSQSRNVIILITDGLEACDNDPCVIAQKLKDKGVNVTPFVIGLGMDLSYLEKFNCIGTYADAENKSTFERVLKKVVDKALLNTTVQIDLNDIYGKPKETNVTMFLYETGTSNLKYTFTHTINKYGNPDTLVIDPAFRYDLVVNTIPKIEKKNIKIKRNIHNTIPVDAPQGYIQLRFINAVKPYVIQARVMQKNKHQTLNVQKIESKDKYLVGNYTVELLTLPRKYIDVTVTQNSIEKIDVLAPGFVKYSVGNGITGQVFHKNKDGKWDWVVNLKDNSRNGEVRLQPGSYRIVYRRKNLKSTTYTTTKDFRIISNKTTSVKL